MAASDVANLAEDEVICEEFFLSHCTSSNGCDGFSYATDGTYRESRLFAGRHRAYPAQQTDRWRSDRSEKGCPRG